MCDPVSIAAATAVISTASATMGFVGQQQQYKSNAQMANITAANTYNGQQEQSAQIDAQQSENTVNAIVQRAQGEGVISAHAGAFGLSGSTTSRLSNAVDFASGRQLSVEDLNSSDQRLQMQNVMVGTDLTRQAQINSVAQADPLSLALGVAKAGLSGTSAYTSAGGKFGANS